MFMVLYLEHNTPLSNWTYHTEAEAEAKFRDVISKDFPDTSEDDIDEAIQRGYMDCLTTEGGGEGGCLCLITCKIQEKKPEPEEDTHGYCAECGEYGLREEFFTCEFCGDEVCNHCVENTSEGNLCGECKERNPDV